MSSRKRNTVDSQPITVLLKRCSDHESDDDDDDDLIEDYAGDSSAITKFDAKIRRGSETIGKAHLVLVDRSIAARGGSSFHMICDEHSGDLESVAAFVCDRSGKADHSRSSIHGHDDIPPTGGFLYIESFRVEENHRRTAGGDFTSIGAEALREILNHPKLRGKWTLAVYVPESVEQMTAAELKERKTHAAIPPEEQTREMQRKKLTMTRKCCKMDARQFLRAGFRQVTPVSLGRNDYYHVFAVPSFVRKGNHMMSHDEAVALPVMDAPERPLPPTGKDFELWECTQMEMRSSLSSMMVGQDPPPRTLSVFETTVRKLVSEGGAIERSNAVHESAKYGNVAALDLLLRIAGSKASEAINAKNTDGHTPLMEAARAATMNFLSANPFAREAPSSVGICDEIISRGADTAETDISGLTALGHMRKQAVSSMRYGGGYKATMEKMETLTRLLMPATGPGPADNAMLSVAEDVEESDSDGAAFDEQEQCGDY